MLLPVANDKTSHRMECDPTGDANGGVLEDLVRYRGYVYRTANQSWLVSELNYAATLGFWTVIVCPSAADPVLPRVAALLARRTKKPQRHLPTPTLVWRTEPNRLKDKLCWAGVI